MTLVPTVGACSGATATNLGGGGDGGGPSSDGGDGDAGPTGPSLGEPHVVTRPPVGNTPIPVHVVVSNQSFAIDPVDITLSIDGLTVAEGDFKVGSQHTFHTFDLEVDPGTHMLRAQTTKGEAVLEKPWDATGERWLTVMYWYYPEGTTSATPTPRSFSIDVSSVEPTFQ